jgi:hypothetical protein
MVEPERKLGIPTVLDRFIQQAVMQALELRREESRHASHQAVEQAQQHQAEGYRWVVDLDLDRVNHDRLLGLRDFHPFHRLWGVGSAEELFPVGGPMLFQVCRQFLDGHPVDAWTAFVGLHSS